MDSGEDPSSARPLDGAGDAVMNVSPQSQRLRRSSTSKLPDRDDADTCRICRGESTTDEPLFYPCKCSGSIKYVHQECLMEWLSHSQKKYCELCKTPFRFTKLYHPGMPPSIPTSVFVRRAAIHILKLFMTWCRAVLVASVWLVVLPWCMRVVWRSLFWVGDGGWTRDDYIESVETRKHKSSPSAFDLDAVRSAVESAKAANASIALPLPSLLMPFSQTLNMTASDPTVLTLIKRFFFGLPTPLQTMSTSSAANSTQINGTTDHLGPRSPSLLSGVTFFNWFPSQAANRFLIDVLEGQIITLIVVVAFILIFLIREWVVQQQPVMNMVALDEAAGRDPLDNEHEADIEDEAEDNNEAEADEDDNHDWVYNTNATDDMRDDDVAEDREWTFPTTTRVRRSSSVRRKRQAVFNMWQDSDEIPDNLRRALKGHSQEEIIRIIGQMAPEDYVKLNEALVKLSVEVGVDPGEILHSSTYTPENSSAVPEASNSRDGAIPERSSSLAHTSKRDTEDCTESSMSSQRPHMPARNRSFIATEIRRSLEENKSWSFASNSQAPGDDDQQFTPGTVPDSWEDEEQGYRSNDKGKKIADHEQGSDHSSESWQQVPDIVVGAAEIETERNDQDNSEKSIVRPWSSSHRLSQSPKRHRDIDEGMSEDASIQSKRRRQESPEGKGKAKLVDESSDDSNDAVSIPSSEGELLDIQTINEGASPEFQASSKSPASLSEPFREQAEAEEPHQQPESDPGSEQSQGQGQDPPRLAPPPPRLLDRIVDWVFGDIAPGVQAAEDVANDEHVVQDLAEEAPFVPFGANEPRGIADLPAQDPEVAAAAAQAGIDVNDQDAIDDAEDLEGIMELIGMQGPLTGLLQNAMFSAVLISATLACAVWLPYLWGKVVILFMGSPVSLFIKLPLQLVATFADLVVDGALCLAAGAVYAVLETLRLLVQLATMGMGSDAAARPIGLAAAPAQAIAARAAERLGKLVSDSPLLPPPTYFRLSINSHVALRTIQNTTSHALNQTSAIASALFEDAASESATSVVLRALYQLPDSLKLVITALYNKLTTLLSWLMTTKSYKITFNLDFGRNVNTAYAALEQWTASDRVIAVLAGYAFFALAGAVYLKRGAPFSSSQQGQKIERIIADMLQQAGGVLKVILIISIEMLVFPLYCGLLLDLALLPLFRNASLYTRWQFTRESPWTSGFVHWFIGTCYMFHFALFVAMCRKILRRGVLYFIRDPDDPTFHPVRDVLERSVTTQLRKIAFSGLVYGALVIVCLGGVVYSLDQLTAGVLPITWVSHAPSLEFPLDLLFYNFLTPVILQVYKPGEGLHAVSAWWFKRCARMLRLSNFLFGDRVKAEEGRKDDGDDIVDGRFVRAPASDQVRIPKGDTVFIEVDKNNVRKDGKSEEGGVHNSDLVTKVYIPPWFRVRIAGFVFTIWLFAAVAGVSVTVIPLLFGRYLFSLFLPSHVDMNDIHACSLGIYSLGSIYYTLYQAYNFLRSIDRPTPSPLATLYNVAATTMRISERVLRFTYVWTSLILAIPFLFAVLIELYFLMPLHAYLGPHEPHVVHLIQDWTLGFLYARLSARIIFSNRASRPARAFSAVIANGYLNPNARIATRCFVLPALILFTTAIAVPSTLALLMNKTVYYIASETTKSQVMRFSYPTVGLAIAGFWLSKEGLSVLTRWRMLVRDEVYLIGERLHNFGDRRAPPPAASGQT